MLTITDPARDRLTRKLARNTKEEGVARRLAHTENDGWRLTLDVERPDDTAYAHGGRSVLLLDPDISRAMTEMTLGVRDTEAGPRLKLSKNPSHGG